MTRAVFLDRDGVLIEDVHLLTKPAQIRILDGVSEALRELKEAGFLLVVVSNQPVVARGMCAESDVVEVNESLAERLREANGVAPDEFHFCPHHPAADLSEYRRVCDCRKPRPGMILAAARRNGVELVKSFMVGDRVSDVAAGRAAGCRTALLETGKHAEKPIESPEAYATAQPDFRCPSLAAAVPWMLGET